MPNLFFYISTSLSKAEAKEEEAEKGPKEGQSGFVIDFFAADYKRFFNFKIND